jgi:hypothetical protein
MYSVPTFCGGPTNQGSQFYIESPLVGKIVAFKREVLK